ncbi:MAG TPA: hypothetical protein VFZ04_04055, partial [Longimicrobiales bacterium]
ALAPLTHRAFGQAHNVDARQPIGDVDFYFDAHGIHPDDRTAADSGKHVRRLIPRTGQENT